MNLHTYRNEVSTIFNPKSKLSSFAICDKFF